MTRPRGKGPTAPVKITFATVAATRDRIQAAAKAAGTDAESVIAEALYVHLHRLESCGDPHLRRKSVCWTCGTLMDDAKPGAKPGTARAAKGNHGKH